MSNSEFNATTLQNKYFSANPDETFPTIEAGIEFLERRGAGETVSVKTREIDFDSDAKNGELFVSAGGRRFEFTASALCSLVRRLPGAQYTYLQTIPANWASSLLGYHAKQAGSKDITQFIFDGNTGLVRGAVSGTYNAEITDLECFKAMLRAKEKTGMIEPPVWENGTARGSVFIGDDDSCVSLISANPDASLVTRRGDSSVSDEIFAALTLRNSEVGKLATRLAMWAFRRICGNLGIVGFDKWIEETVRHTKLSGEAKPGAESRIAALLGSISSKAEAGNQFARLAISQAEKLQAITLPTDREAVISLLRAAPASEAFGKREAEAVIDMAYSEEGGLWSAYQLAQGVTATARDMTRKSEAVAFLIKGAKLNERLINSAS